MSHTWKHGETTFTGNSDLSGKIKIVTHDPDFGREMVEVPGADILAFVAGHLRRERITEIEQASDADILEGKV